MNTFLHPSKLKLDELRVIARTVPSPLRWAVVWFLLWIEPKYIDYKSKQAVDTAIKDYNKLHGTGINFIIDNTKPIESKPSKVKGLNDYSIEYYTKLDEEYIKKMNDPECDI